MKLDPDEELARSVALKALDAAPRSRAQLAELLAKKEVPARTVARVLDRFEEVGLIDDQALAGALVRTRLSERGLVGQALSQELRRKGIAPDVAATAMAQVTREDEAAAAEHWALKKLAATRSLPTQTRLRRAASQLARKGHPPGVAFETVKRLLAQEEACSSHCGQPLGLDQP
ncbi:MAG: RecX family transcriptional regulator [Bifidobacteriaceae bacterium]|nr:RecX family transcriptional regulator [Bifidobacteriaceae bacterium]